ncbi:hypothetical protein [Sporolactobacillus vineae]|uniref:hypothetical protein n=1 Tax=Sporolactobacillus vineae TaxID=444463 RepID=UPI00114696FA|nr:hypothetical protein [Sporolactobacillus vineae]
MKDNLLIMLKAFFRFLVTFTRAVFVVIKVILFLIFKVVFFGKRSLDKTFGHVNGEVEDMTDSMLYGKNYRTFREALRQERREKERFHK